MGSKDAVTPGCKGQDWASYQDWSPSTAGLGFVFIKATEGTGYVNPRYSAQLAAARAGRVVPGHYHFVRPGPSMQAQGDYFLRHLTLKAGDVLALDWEDGGVTGSEKDAFLKYLKAAAPGHKVVLYCNKDFWLHRDHSSYAADGLWIADPDSPMGQPQIKDPWLFHQYGSPHGMDVDYCRLDAAALRAWAAGTTPTPTPEPNMSLPQTDLDAIAKAVAGYSHGDDPDVHQTWQDSAADANAAKVQARTNGNTLSALTTKVDAVLAKVETLGAAPAALSDAQVQQVAASLAANPAFVQALSAGVGKDIAARMQS